MLRLGIVTTYAVQEAGRGTDRHARTCSHPFDEVSALFNITQSINEP